LPGYSADAVFNCLTGTGIPSAYAHWNAHGSSESRVPYSAQAAVRRLMSLSHMRYYDGHLMGAHILRRYNCRHRRAVKNLPYPVCRARRRYFPWRNGSPSEEICRIAAFITVLMQKNGVQKPFFQGNIQIAAPFIIFKSKFTAGFHIFCREIILLSFWAGDQKCADIAFLPVSI